jgi:probable O-glycosylation ligase (exosortase A-associated)
VFTIITGGNFHIYGPDSSMIGDNNHLAAALLVALPLVNYVRMQSAFGLIRVAGLVAMVIIVAAILGSYSRGALLGLGAVTLFLWLNSRNKAAIGLGLVLVTGGGIMMMPPQWMERMNTIQTYDEDASATGRINIWMVSLKIALARPLIGGGFLAPYSQDIVNRYDPEVKARAVHSIYFEVIGEHGFPAFAVWLGMMMTGLLNTVWIRRRCAGKPELDWAGDLAKMGQTSIVAYLTAGTFLSLCYWDYIFTLLVVLANTRTLIARDLAPAVPVGPRRFLVEKRA